LGAQAAAHEAALTEERRIRKAEHDAVMQYLGNIYAQFALQGAILLPPLPLIQGSPHTLQVSYFIMFFIQFE
jgi:hypothetical protein